MVVFRFKDVVNFFGVQYNRVQWQKIVGLGWNLLMDSSGDGKESNAGGSRRSADKAVWDPKVKHDSRYYMVCGASCDGDSGI